MSDPLSSAVISEAVTRATSFITGKCSEYRSVNEWIDRLEMLHIKMKSAVEVSEAIDINIKPLHKWKEKLNQAIFEAEEALNNFQAEILHEMPNQTIEDGSSARDRLMQEEKNDDATLVNPASNLRDGITRQVDIEANLPHDPFMQEEGSDDATLGHPVSNLREAITLEVEQEANLPHDPFMQEKGSDDATLRHAASNLREAITRQVDLEANLPHDKSMLEGYDDATLVHPTSFFSSQEAIIHQVKLSLLETLKRFGFAFLFNLTSSPWPAIIERLSAFARVLDPRTFSLQHPQMMINEYLENDEKVRKLIKTVEKLEKMASDIGDFIVLLKLQSKIHMCRKRKRERSPRPRKSQGFFMGFSLNLQLMHYFATGKILICLLSSCFVQTAIYLLESPVIFSSDSSCAVLFTATSIICHHSRSM